MPDMDLSRDQRAIVVSDPWAEGFGIHASMTVGRLTIIPQTVIRERWLFRTARWQ